MENSEVEARYRPMQHLWSAIWKTKTLPKIKVFRWKLVVKALAVRDSLSRRVVRVAPTCLMYDHIEPREHLITGCDWVKLVWKEMLGLQDTNDGCNRMEDWLMKRSSEGGSFRSTADTRWKTTLTTCWAIWKARCGMIFQGKQPNMRGVISSVRKMLEELRHLRQSRFLQ